MLIKIIMLVTHSDFQKFVPEIGTGQEQVALNQTAHMPNIATILKDIYAHGGA